MIGLNDRIKQYMKIYGYSDIVLNIENITS